MRIGIEFEDFSFDSTKYILYLLMTAFRIQFLNIIYIIIFSFFRTQ